MKIYYQLTGFSTIVKKNHLFSTKNRSFFTTMKTMKHNIFRGVVEGGGQCPLPRTSEIYGFQGVFKPQRVLSPILERREKLSPPAPDKFLTTPGVQLGFSWVNIVLPLHPKYAA